MINSGWDVGKVLKCRLHFVKGHKDRRELTGEKASKIKKRQRSLLFLSSLPPFPKHWIWENVTQSLILMIRIFLHRGSPWCPKLAYISMLKFLKHHVLPFLFFKTLMFMYQIFSSLRPWMRFKLKAHWIPSPWTAWHVSFSAFKKYLNICRGKWVFFFFFPGWQEIREQTGRMMGEMWKRK